ncbi:hypothetical protein NLX67_17225 [Domibacillus sp. A3M-37]|uniref:hypothetical protein n=1 Tax=Domibacillus sp. A3M-37 TaxID=2962037 RepID=UPI0020B8E62E|nr:hypothetical protein [Domibacillus sp. A3M-37]MCP3764095.1 hypothetical protein [Domibacillus sp. A3M-37]
MDLVRSGILDSVDLNKLRAEYEYLLPDLIGNSLQYETLDEVLEKHEQFKTRKGVKIMTTDRSLVQLVVNQTEYLSRMQSPTLQALLEKAKDDHRVRLILPFYARMKYPNAWRRLVKHSRSFKKYNRLMEESLGRLETSSGLYASFAYQLRDNLFSRHTSVKKTDQYDEAEEMKKMVKTWYNRLNRDEVKYQRAKRKAEALLNGRSFEDLLKPVKPVGLVSGTQTKSPYKKSLKARKNLVLAKAK